ncbi:SEN1 N terminal-domain-containing protein [Cercophora newfieldiana]|uniref:SEN1 N terminal-domain-containing protein n=1 Tax=Cercophora newfieldiana TaxID=92897 RepID=A0AA39YQ31_9PEZI|nr:SEN1 N terminal-domain-containing protein [Cercophora newfieldiana]
MLYSALVGFHNEFQEYPPEAHLFCPRVDGDDPTLYDEPDIPDQDGASSEEKHERIAAAGARQVTTYRLSLLLGIREDVASTWKTEWKETVNKFLSQCDRCARNYHKIRGHFVKSLESDLSLEDVDMMQSRLNEFDAERIGRGIKRAKEILEKNGPLSTSKLAQQDMSCVLALFEALCCPSYLALPENREDFNFVFENMQQKRPLRMDCGIIPTMTYFLFDDNPYRFNFAKAGWERKAPESLKVEEWDWSVGNQLKQTILASSAAKASPEKIKRFWRGLRIILPALSEQHIQEQLRGMEVSPNVYYLAMEHLGTHDAEALGQVLQGLWGLIEKSPKSFWEALEQVTPSQMVEEIFKSPAFRAFLDESLLPERMWDDGEQKRPALAVWTKSLIRSLKPDRRSDTCESLLQYLFDKFRRDPSASQEARAASTLAGLVALGGSLEGYLDRQSAFDTGTALINVNQILNRVVQYRDVIMSAAQLKPGDRYNVGLSETALSIIHSALALDAKATRIEWNALIDKKPVQDAVKRDSGALWESFLEILWSGRVELAKAMLMATMPLMNIEKFIPVRKESLTMPLKRFNERFRQQTTSIGAMLGRLSDFNPSDLDMFCSEAGGKTIKPIVSTLFHGEEPIREAGFELVKAITSEISPSDAITKMLEDYFTPFLNAFTNAVSNLLSEDPSRSSWTHMLPLLKCGEFILDGLCDPSVGQLRFKTLTDGERKIVTSWWESQWRVVSHSFKMMRTWHVKVDKKVMEDFCRDVMEFANKLLAQDGLMASALSKLSRSSNIRDIDTAAAEAMKIVLEPPSNISSYAMVDMLQLRDKYLIQGIVDVTKKLLVRLKDNDMVLPKKTIAHINNMVKRRQSSTGEMAYAVKTNMTDEQRIEILKALGEEEEIDLQFIGIKAGEREAKEKERALKQSRLDFSKATSASLSAVMKSHVDSLTPHLSKRASTLEALKPLKPVARPEAKPLLNATSIKEARAKEKAEKAKRDAEAIAKAKALRAPPKTVAGEGSGLQGIAGVRGKDHTPMAKDEIMVGSSSEDEDEDEEDEILARRGGTGKKAMDDAERRRLRLLAETKGPVKKVKIQRSAKDMRARLIPPMDVLHQAILEWDIFHEGNDPPNDYRCAEVSDMYQNPISYKQTFFPLLVNEAWRSFVTAKDEATSKPFGVKVLNRMSVDKFMEVTASVPTAISKDRGLSEGDIVIVSRGEDPLNQPGEMHCLARIWKTTYKKDTVEVIYRLSTKGNPILPALLPGSEFSIVKITNMTTIEREYAALESLQYYDLMDEILKAEVSPTLNFGNEAIEGVMKNWQLNTGQAKAILNARENDGFTLVQGPPGTGKTKTIVAMVGCLLTGMLKSNGNAVPISRPGATPTSQGTSKKLLVCAPSNAAVDELVLRLKQGVKTSNGSFHKIDVLRLGRSDAINAAVRDVTLDELVRARMDAVLNKNEPSDREKLHKEAGELKQKYEELRPQLEAARASDDRLLANKLQREWDELKRRRAHIGARIDADKSSGNTFQRETEIKRRQIQQEILDKSQVLCATLSGSGHEMFKNLNVEFETVIIDEAAQCVELSALIPLKYGCSKCILVGDPKQLPPTVLSQSAARYGYDQSLFVRMQKNHSKHVHLLDQQYRMHPEISKFPSKEFYEGLLQDGDDMAKLRLQPWHRSVLLGPYRFFDVRGSQERGPRNQSLINEEELRVAMQLYKRFKTDYRDVDLKGKIGIITPYKAQLYRLRQRFAEAYGDAITEEIEFNTTDAFQGRECEIIIFSCVRASPTGGIGFMTDIRRMNVGLTRARSSLWILGDSRALVQGEFWAKLIDDSKRRDRYTTGNIMGMLSQPGQQLPAAAFASLAESKPVEKPEIEKGDVQMRDAPMPPHAQQSMQASSSYANQRSQQPVPLANNQQALARRPSSSSHQAPAPRMSEATAPPVGPYRGPSIGGLNNRGEAVNVVPRGSGPPPILPTSSTAKKRHLDANEGLPTAKKVLNTTSTCLRYSTPESTEGATGAPTTDRPFGYGSAWVGPAISAISPGSTWRIWTLWVRKQTSKRRPCARRAKTAGNGPNDSPEEGCRSFHSEKAKWAAPMMRRRS